MIIQYETIVLLFANYPNGLGLIRDLLSTKLDCYPTRLYLFLQDTK